MPRVTRDLGSCECCGAASGGYSGSGGIGPCCGLTPADTLIATITAPSCPLIDGKNFTLPWVSNKWVGSIGTTGTCDNVRAEVSCSPITGQLSVAVFYANSNICGVGEENFGNASIQCNPLIITVRGQCEYYGIFLAFCCDAAPPNDIIVTITKL